MMEVMLDAGVRAVQSTPLVGTSGEPLGMLSTHYRTPYKPSCQDLAVIDYFARWAAALLEWHDHGLMKTEKLLSFRMPNR